MRTIYIMIVLATLGVMSMVGCGKEDCPSIDDEDCLNKNSLETPFLTKIGCDNTLYTDTMISIKVMGIEDNRSFGYTECSSSQGGFARIYIEASYLEEIIKDTFSIRGCSPEYLEYDISNPNLPSMQIENYEIKLMKLFPSSLELDEPLEDKSDYDIKLGILN